MTAVAPASAGTIVGGSPTLINFASHTLPQTLSTGLFAGIAVADFNNDTFPDILAASVCGPYYR